MGDFLPPSPLQGIGLGDGVRAALNIATSALGPVSATPRLDAELLMALAMGVSREALLLRHLDDPIPEGFAALLARRLQHEPVAYITGSRAFWTIDLAVGPGVLVPRADSETLIEAAVRHFGRTGPARVLDLGTGPGTLLLAALAQWPQASGIGIDRSPIALDYARRNAHALGLADRAAFRQGNWAAGVTERFDLVLANPPYIAINEDLPAEVRAHEPAEALFAGTDGLDDYRAFIPDLARLIVPGGIAVLEIGHRQAEPVAAIVSEARLSSTAVNDLANHPRALVVS